MEGLKIGDLASKTNTNIETIRFYERRGLLKSPPRKKQEFGSHPGYRLYPAETVQRLRFIRRSKELGLTLKEILHLLSIADGIESGCSEIYEFASEKVNEVKEKIKDLKKIQRMLEDLSKRCNLNSDLSKCPIIESLNRD